MNKLITSILFFVLLCGCAGKKDPNYLGHIRKLPPGEYIIYSYGSRHIVKCVKSDGKWYSLNDADFEENNIPGYDAHQYLEETKITIK